MRIANTSIVAGCLIAGNCFAVEFEATYWPVSDGGNGHWYAVVSQWGGTCWDEAKLHAEGLGGYLATITSQEEQVFIDNALIASSWDWLGGFQNTATGEWNWVTNEEWMYTNWAGGEPSGGNEHYLTFHVGGTQWNDFPLCSTDGNNYVIEWEDNPSVKQWIVEEGGNGHWYSAVYVGAGLTWAEANTMATEMGGYLATPVTEDEDLWIFNTLGSDSFLWSCGYGPFLGGVQDENGEEPSGGWTWISGEPWLYEAWDGAPGNCCGGQDHLQYGVGNGQITKFWNDVNLNDSNSCFRSFIVEWNPDCNENGIDDSFDIAKGYSQDCNENGIPDECDIAEGTSPDVNPIDGIPDECQGLPVGGCCFGTQCVETTANACLINGGEYLGDSIWCEDLICGVTGTGGCCINGNCLPTTLDECFSAGGSFAGEWMTCIDVSCPTNCAADLDGNGLVDVNDLLIIIAAWGACP